MSRRNSLRPQHPSTDGTTRQSKSMLPCQLTATGQELRNRIYRAYFEDSARRGKHTMNIKKAAPAFLNLSPTDRMIRSEAMSIFFKEFLSVDSFIAPEDLEGAHKSSIKSICALGAICGIKLPLTITVQESIVGDSWYVHYFRSAFLGKLMRFITSEINEWFARTAGSQKSEERAHFSGDQSMRSESVVHASHRYRIERLHPDAASLGWMATMQQNNPLNVAANWHVHAQQFLGLQGAYQPIREGADFIRVEGPLVELDWRKFEWSPAGAHQRHARVHEGR